MPRADEPRVTLRLSVADEAVLREAAERRGVRLGTLIRQLAVSEAERIRSSERAPRMRRRSASVPVPAPAASSSEVEKSEPVSEAKRYVAGLKERYAVKTGRELAMERQRKLNERRP